MRKIIPKEALLVPDQAERVFKGVIYDVYQWPQELYDGSIATFEMLRRADTVTAICIVEDKIIVLNDTQPHRGERIGFPGGRIDDTDASPLEAVQREIYEETGYKFTGWKLIKVVQPLTKIEWFVHEYVAWDCYEKFPAHNEPGERIVVNEMSFDRVRAMAGEGQGYLGTSAEFFAGARSPSDLLAIPAFDGRAVNR